MLDIDFKFPEWARAVTAAEAEINLFIAATVQTNRGLLFDSEGSALGHKPWKKLLLREGQILSQRGALRRSIAPYNPNGTPGPDGIVRFAGDVITVGTRLAYAKMMNYGTVGLPGGVLRPRNAKALKIPLPAGKSASKVARDIRSAPVEAAIANQRQKVAKASLAESKAARSFEKGGDSRKMMRAYRAAISRQRNIETLAKLEARAAKIRSTGRGGQQFMFLKSVRIPPRNFIDWNESDQEELDAALMSKLAEVLNRGRS